MEDFAPRIAIWPLGDADDGDIFDAEILKRCADGGELALAAIDEQEIGPVFAARPVLIGIFGLQAGEAAVEHGVHHGEIIAGCDVGAFHVEFAVLVFEEA